MSPRHQASRARHEASRSLDPLRAWRFVGWIGGGRCDWCRRDRPGVRAAILRQPARVRNRGGLGGGRGGRGVVIEPERHAFACEVCMREAFQWEEVR